MNDFSILINHTVYSLDTLKINFKNNIARKNSGVKIASGDTRTESPMVLTELI